MNNFGPDEISQAELEAAVGPFNPPQKSNPASRALYASFVLLRLNPRALPNLFLLGNGPDELLELEETTKSLRAEHTVSELKKLARAELN